MEEALKERDLMVHSGGRKVNGKLWMERGSTVLFKVMLVYCGDPHCNHAPKPYD